MDDEFLFKLDLLKLEMNAVQSGMQTYGQVQFTIKGWAITVFSGFVFFAAKESQPIFLGLSAIAVILFWILDAIFKSIQTVYIHRALEIEQFLQGLEARQSKRAFQNFAVPNIETSFRQLSGKAYLKSVLHAAYAPQLAILYVVMLVAIAVVAFVRNGKP